MARTIKILEGFFYSFPIQLLLNNLKRNHVLLLCWIILFAMVTGNFGRYLGIPYLFLDPEYLHNVNFTSFAIMGLAIAGLTVAFHITCYITDGHRFSFIGTVSKPFTKFSINNSIIPLAFVITYLCETISFQLDTEYTSRAQIITNISGFMLGFIVMTSLLFIYFWFTNKDIFKYVVCQIDEKIKQNVQITRASAMRKLDIARKKQVRVDYFLDFWKVRKVEDNSFYDRATIIQVFDQNHFNLVIIELFIFVLVLILGIFKDHTAFQLPAAASFIIFLTIFIMLAGAFSYWFGGWSVTTALIIFLFINYLFEKNYFQKKYDAFGLNYEAPRTAYTIEHLRQLCDSTTIAKDRAEVLVALKNWRSKFGEADPKMVFTCVSGGGKRAALWTLTALQAADSVTNGKLMENTMLITGASGGLIGAGYFRELKLQQKLNKRIHPYAERHLWQVSADNLNPIIFSLLANDLFVGFTKFEYNGKLFVKDRSYTFEEQLDRSTDRLMDKPLKDYRDPELKSVIPMMILSPTVVTDGRRLHISPLPVSFLNSDLLHATGYDNPKVSGVDFQRLFEEQEASNLRFLSALRMSATFPYITPNTTLPSDPPIEIMDAGISDNFGITDAVSFLYAFRDWIAENTSGVIFLSIRDSPKLSPVTGKSGQSLVDNFYQPISNVYNNFENFQDIANDHLIGYAHSWFAAPIHRVDIEYKAETLTTALNKADSIRQNNARASLSWRLTTREKQGIINNISTSSNRESLEKLKELLE